MEIKEITIQNFRGFDLEAGQFAFNQHFTAIIGDNGKGKTTIMEALACIIDGYFAGMEGLERQRPFNYAKDIHKMDNNDYSFSYHFPVIISAQININEKSIKCVRFLKSLKSKFITDAPILVEIAQRNEEIIAKGEEVDLPVFCYFGLGMKFEKKNKTTFKTKNSKLIDGYDNCLNPNRNNRETYIEWIKSYEYMTNPNIKNPQVLEIVKQDPHLLNAVKKAIETCFEEWTDLHFDAIEDDLVGFYKKKDLEDEEDMAHRLPFKLLSDGQRRVVGVVAELAYRCAILNGHREENAIKESKGVVLIDEIDLHLHPNWQKRIVNDLKRTFPKIQFIVTTHSPFIVQSLKKEELINLDRNEGVEGDFFTHSIEDVAEFEMGVENVQRSNKFLEMEAVASEYFSLVTQGKTSNKNTNTAKLRQRLNELEELYNDDPAFVALLKAERNTNKNP
jgi:predicted ATP-binding protein involved in virulence